ncbi:MAG TPA: rRNA maturation RNase YbeY [Burkholderiaceae bacterium]
MTGPSVPRRRAPRATPAFEQCVLDRGSPDRNGGLRGPRPRAAGRAASNGGHALSLSIQGAAAYAAELPARATLAGWVGRALERPAELALVFVDGRSGRRLNREFRQRDYATNVLTFSYHQRPRVVADIVICVPVARREARQQRKTLRAHLAHLLLHGVLHAQGYDHQRGADAARMQRREVELLGALRIADPYREPVE